MSMALDAPTRARLGRRAQQLAAVSVGYNAVEAVVSISAGAAASSIALVGFGLDSVVEMSSGLVILWQFRHPLPETRERRALRLIGFSFFTLAAYVSVESVRALVDGAGAGPSRLGIAVAAVSLLVMPTLSWAQRRTGRLLGSSTVVADSKQTLLCTYLSAVLLAGLALNAAFGWWWADAVVGLVVAGLAVREGRQAWHGEACGCVLAAHAPPASGALELGRAGAAGGCGCSDEGCRC
jgi:divalent metal cation (Fe/Co/Zn/Cd) transporter